jgi:hypothetical protein
MFVWLSRVFLVGAAGLAGWAAWQMVSAPTVNEAVPQLVLDWPVLEVGEQRIGAHEFVIRVSNPSGRLRQIMGISHGCRPNVCFGPKVEGPVAVPPGETVAYACEFEVAGAGPFEFPIVLCLADGCIREVEMTLRGVGVAPEGPTDVRGQ